MKLLWQFQHKQREVFFSPGMRLRRENSMPLKVVDSKLDMDLKATEQINERKIS